MGIDGTYPLLIALWLLPLAGAIACWAFGPQLKAWAGRSACTAMGASFVLTALSWGAGTQNAGGALGRSSIAIILDPRVFRFRAAARSAFAAVDVYHHRRRVSDPLLLDGIHGRRSRICARFSPT